MHLLQRLSRAGGEAANKAAGWSNEIQDGLANKAKANTERLGVR